MKTLAQVQAERFCAGFIMVDDVVVEAAPILRRHLMGRSRDEARAICEAKGWTVVVVSQTDAED
jgi:hypothetical protein